MRAVADMKEKVAFVTGSGSGIGRNDYLVNHAGFSAAGPKAPLQEVTLDAFTRVLDVNVVGPFLCMKYAVPAMLQTGGGAVVNLSSTMGERASAGDPSDPTSNHAVRGLTRSAALTYAEGGIRVNSVGPGVVKTGMTEAGWLRSV